MTQFKEIIAKDADGIKRCYGIGETRQRAIIECKQACLEYLGTRPDIAALYLYDEHDKPVFDAATYSVTEVTA